jgi:threonine dehydratase
MPVTIVDIRAARERIADSIYRSPCQYSLALSRLCRAKIHCKLDHLQVTGSFKERGARNRLLQLTPLQRSRGVIAASAGNHALGLAYHGQQLGIPVTVVMPVWAPLTKVQNCRSFNAEVIQIGESFDEAREHAFSLRDQRGLCYVNGFDDKDIIAGQGTMGLEILEDVPDVDAVIIPIGGGGLIAGVGRAIKALKPGVRIIGVEAESAPSYTESKRAGKVVRVKTTPTLADGLAIAEMGQLCFEIAQEVVDEVVLVDESHLAKAVLRLLELDKTVLEGAGAAPLAAMLQHSLGLDGKKVVLCLCGGNIDITMLDRVIDRGLASDGRLCRLRVSVSDRPGGLARISRIIADVGASVKELYHDRNFGVADVQTVDVICILETRDRPHVDAVIAALRSAGFPVREGG